ncbi:MAG: phosphoglycerate mutase family protein [Pyrinomonadaceae bacterium]
MKTFPALPRLIGLTLLTLAVLSPLVLIPSGAATTIEADSRPTPEDNFKVTTVFLVRHAEKADAPREDPPLSEAGKLRAQALARLLGPSGVTAIYTSQFLRTKQTAEPLAKQLGLTPISLTISLSPSNPREVSGQSIKEITDKIHERPGEGSLVIGHSNTVPEVIKLLGGDAIPKIDEQKFDDLFVVTVYGRGKAKVAHLKYEAPSPERSL